LKLITVSPYNLEWHDGYCYLVSTIKFSGYEIAYRPRILYSAPDATSVQLMNQAKDKFEADQVDYQPNMLLPLADEGFEAPPDQFPLHTDAAPDEHEYWLTELGKRAIGKTRE